MSENGQTGSMSQESAAATVAVLETARRLVIDMPTVLATEPRVYAGLQRLACDVETTIFAADSARASEGVDSDSPSRPAGGEETEAG